MSTTLTRADVARIAELARLALTPDELDLSTRQLGDILGTSSRSATSTRRALRRPRTWPARPSNGRCRRAAAVARHGLGAAPRRRRGGPLQGPAGAVMADIQTMTRAPWREGIREGRLRRPRSARRFSRGSRRTTRGLGRSRWCPPRPRARRSPTPGPDMPLAGVPVAVKDNICTAECRRCGIPHPRRGTCRRTRPRWSSGSKPPGPSSWARRTSTSSPWARPPRTRRSARRATRWTSSGRRADRGRLGGGGGGPDGPRRALGPIRAARFASRRPSVAWSASSRPTGGLALRAAGLASSLDQIGPLTHTVEDAAPSWVIAGHDPRDATSSTEPVPDYLAALDRGVAGLRVGVPRAMLADGVDRTQKASPRRSTCGGRPGPPSSMSTTSHAGHGIPVYYLIAPPRPRPTSPRYDGVRYGRRAEVGRQEGLAQMLTARGMRASAPRSSGASCSARMRSAPATTTPTT